MLFNCWILFKSNSCLMTFFFLLINVIFCPHVLGQGGDILIFEDGLDRITYNSATGVYNIDYVYGDSVYSGALSPGNLVLPIVSASVIDSLVQGSDSLLTYKYSISNESNALMGLYQIILKTGRNYNNVEVPQTKWNYRYSARLDGLRWVDNNSQIKGILPGSTEEYFSFNGAGLPGIIDGFGQSESYLGFNYFGPTGKIREAIDSLRTVTKQVMFTTVGPVSYGVSYDIDVLLDSLVTYPDRSLSLSWITNAVIATNLKDDLIDAQTNLINNELAAAEKLAEVLELVESQKYVDLTSEAYALFKYNIQFILSQISSYTELSLTAGWQLAGLPLDVQEPAYDSVYTTPSLTQPPFWWDGTRYVLENDMVVGHGYWVETDTSGIQPVIGTPIDSLNLDMGHGWELFAGPSCDVASSAISDPSGIIITGTLFGFDNGYVVADTLRQGKGYWVMTNAVGQLTIDCNATGANKTGIPALVYRPNASGTFAEINIQDANRGRQTLYLGGTLTSSSNISFSLPPIPPQGFFDARFEDGTRLTEEPEGLIQLQVSQFPTSVSLGGNTSNLIFEELVNGQVVATHNLAVGQSIEISNNEVNALRIRPE